MKQTLIHLIIIGTFSYSCSSKFHDGPQSLSVNLAEQDEVSIFDIFESVEIVALETSDQSLVAGISKVIHFDSRYYILDQKQQRIACFDSAGKFLFKISQRGQGPEEYLFLGDFNIDPYTNQLLLVEPFGSLLLFDLEGRFISKIRLPGEINAYNRVYPLDENRLVFSSLFNYELVFYDRKKNIIVDRRYGVEDMKLRETPFEPKQAYRYNGDLFFPFSPSNDVINLSDNTIFSWNFGKLTNTEETIGRLKDFILHSKTGFRALPPYHEYDWVGEKKLNNIVRRCFESSRYKIYILSCGRGCLKHIFYDKKAKKSLVFDKTKEGIFFRMPDFFGESMLMYDRGLKKDGNLDLEMSFFYYHPNTFTEEQLRLYESRKIDDNPFLVIYNFRQ